MHCDKSHGQALSAASSLSKHSIVALTMHCLYSILYLF